MKNRKLRKFLMLVSSALLLVCVTVGATVAYLTAETGPVTNTFTIGNVRFALSGGLDEADVDEYGEPIEGAERVTANEYKLLPGHNYTKDPTVHVDANSDAAWLFVTVDNQIAAIEAGTTIANQITNTYKWNELKDSEGNLLAYYKELPAETDAKDYIVFSEFTLKDDLSSTTLDKYNDKKVIINAYLIQKDGFTTADLAWAEIDKTYIETATPDPEPR